MERFNPAIDYGGNEQQDLTKFLETYWKHITVAVLIVLVIYVVYFRQNFINGVVLATKQIPYTSGADLRFNSIDSATNRGRSSIGFF